MRAALWIAAWIVLCGAAAPAALKDHYARQVRVQTIARRILAANVGVCPTTRTDLGFTALSLDPKASAALRAAWSGALGLDDHLTVVAIYAGGPAEAAGLGIGDRVIAVQDLRWPPDTDSRSRFAKAIADLGPSPVNLTVQRGADERVIALAPQPICAADITLTGRRKVNAQATGDTIAVEGGLERLLTSDDELAWVLAHEAAHVFLGHSSPDRIKDTKTRATRAQMEQDADALGVRLMLKAGYPPEVAADAHLRIAMAARGPISTLLDLHGPYLGTKQRAAFLRREAAAARSEATRAAP